MSVVYSLDSGFDEDLRNIVVLSLLEKIHDGSFSVSIFSCDNGKEKAFNQMMLWLVKAFESECNARIRSRLPKKTPDSRGGDKMLLGSSFNESDYAGKIDLELDDYEFTSDVDYITEILNMSIREKLIKALGEDKEAIVDDYLASFTYAEMAERHGGTEDRYRKMFSRAMKRVSGLWTG